jgi:RNA polymerase sigma factor (sigma-70 family)
MASDNSERPTIPIGTKPVRRTTSQAVDGDALTSLELLAVIADRPTRRAVPAGPSRSPGELLAGCQRGDRASWVALVDRYETLVYTVARRNGLSAHDAADVTQSTFATLLRRLDDVRDAERLPSWLATVARREAWRVIRLEKREQSLSPETEAVDNDTANDWVRREAIEVALNQLGEPCRQLLLWMFFDPAAPTHAEIAKRLGRAVGGIGPLRGRCLEKLRTLLEEGGEL